jgi:hypothetical protein
MENYHRLSTDAPKPYGQVLGCQLLGHALGYNTINLIQPNAVHHNCYSCLVGLSTISRKTTSQELGSDIYPYERWLSAEISPEQLIVQMSKRPERFQWLGEFTDILKGITGGGYMARTAELYNHLHGCPRIYVREIREKKGLENEFTIEHPYLSISSTITPQMLKQYLTEEIFEGGLLPRWLLVSGDPHPRPRGRLQPSALKANEMLQNILGKIVAMEKNVVFEFDDDALGRFNAIEEEWYQKYDRVLAFAGRYLNYLVAFADILLVSDAVGVHMEKGDFYEIRALDGLMSLDDLDGLSEKSDFIKLSNIDKPSKHIKVSKPYVDSAQDIIQPCLDYALELADYVEIEKPTARFMEYLRKVNKAPHWKVMQNAKLSAKQMKEAVETLVQRRQIKNERINEGNWYTWIAEEKRAP